MDDKILIKLCSEVEPRKLKEYNELKKEKYSPSKTHEKYLEKDLRLIKKFNDWITKKP